jgi:hypothetical protein
MRTPLTLRAAATLALAVQLAAAALGTVGMCLDRPHTHAGVPAPDCPMHHQQQGEAAVDPSHHHHHGSQSTSGAAVGCSCSADALLFLLTTPAVIAQPPVLDAPHVATAPSLFLTERVRGMRVAPLSPPPRPVLS